MAKDTETHLIMECWREPGLSVLVKDNGGKISDMHKMMSGVKRVNRDQMFQCKDGLLASSRHPARAQQAVDWRKQRYTGQLWNALPPDAVNAEQRKGSRGWGKMNEVPVVNREYKGAASALGAP